MKFPSFPFLVRTFYTLSNYSARIPQTHFTALQPFTRGSLLKSMPTIPFLSSFFSTSSSPKMSYPVEKSNEEWQAVLSKGQL
jgi:peptide-methionine (R)-S-oxide reductase